MSRLTPEAFEAEQKDRLAPGKGYFFPEWFYQNRTGGGPKFLFFPE